MTNELCNKYLAFVYGECDRFLADGRVTNDELNQLIIEFNRFKNQVKASSLDTAIKERIAELSIDYPEEQVTQGYWYILFAILSLGLFALISNNLRQRKRKNVLQKLKNDTSDILVFIKHMY